MPVYVRFYCDETESSILEYPDNVSNEELEEDMNKWAERIPIYCEFIELEEKD